MLRIIVQIEMTRYEKKVKKNFFFNEILHSNKFYNIHFVYLFTRKKEKIIFF